MYLDANNLYGWAMSQKLLVNNFKQKKNYLNLIKTSSKNYDEDSNKGHIHEVDVEFPKHLPNLHGDLPFLAERMKIKKCNKLLCNLHDKKEDVDYIRALKEALIHGLVV